MSPSMQVHLSKNFHQPIPQHYFTLGPIQEDIATEEQVKAMTSPKAEKIADQLSALRQSRLQGLELDGATPRPKKVGSVRRV